MRWMFIGAATQLPVGFITGRSSGATTASQFSSLASSSRLAVLPVSFHSAISGPLSCTAGGRVAGDHVRAELGQGVGGVAGDGGLFPDAAGGGEHLAELGDRRRVGAVGPLVQHQGLRLLRDGGPGHSTGGERHGEHGLRRYHAFHLPVCGTATAPRLFVARRVPDRVDPVCSECDFYRLALRFCQPWQLRACGACTEGGRSGDPGRIRTADLPLRRRSLYPLSYEVSLLLLPSRGRRVNQALVFCRAPAAGAASARSDAEFWMSVRLRSIVFVCAVLMAALPARSEPRGTRRGRGGDEGAERRGLRDRSLAAYVREVGMRLVAAAGRQGEAWRFTVLDTPDANAFALPGRADLRDARHAGAGRRRGRARGDPRARGRPCARWRRSLSLRGDRARRAAEFAADAVGMELMVAGRATTPRRRRIFSRRCSRRMISRRDCGAPRRDRSGRIGDHPALADRLRVGAGRSAGRPVGERATATPISPPSTGWSGATVRRRASCAGADFLHPDLRFAFEAPAGYALANRPDAVIAAGPGRGAAAPRQPARSRRHARDLSAGGWVPEIARGVRVGPIEALRRLTLHGMAAAQGMLPLGVAGELAGRRADRGAARRALLPPDRAARAGGCRRRGGAGDGGGELSAAVAGGGGAGSGRRASASIGSPAATISRRWRRRCRFRRPARSST